MLKAELRNMERSQKREGVDLTYLKNVILKLLETGTHVGRSITKRELFFSPFVDWSIKVQGMFQTRWFWLPCWIFTEQVKWRYYCLLLQCFCNSVLKRWNLALFRSSVIGLTGSMIILLYMASSKMWRTDFSSLLIWHINFLKKGRECSHSPSISWNWLHPRV